MAKQIEGVYERILACARKEFLQMGFAEASLRVIASEAQTTTGSIYTRFGDKQGLFEAIVGTAAEGMRKMFLATQEEFDGYEPAVKEETVYSYSSGAIDTLVDYLYEHFEEFKLIVCCSAGTKYEHFIDELMEYEVEYTYRYMDSIGCESIRSGLVTEDFIHMIGTAYYNGMFEVVRHDMSRAQAKKYIHMLEVYHFAGFDTIFHPEKYL